MLVLFFVFPTICGAQTRIDSLNQLYNVQTNDSVRAIINQLLGNEFRLNGNDEEAIAHYFEALQYFSENENRQQEAIVLKNIGETYRSKDKPHLAVDNFLKASRMFERQGATREIIDICNSLTELFMRQSDIKNAEAYSEKAERLLNNINYPAGQAQWFNRNGRILNNYKKYDSAIWNYTKAIGLFDSLKLYHGKGRAMHNMANSYRELGELDTALLISKEVLKIKEINENLKSRIFTLLLVADISNNKGDYQNAIKYARIGLELAEAHGFIDRKRVALLYLSESYESIGDFKSAMFYHKRYANLMDTVFDINIFEKVAQLETLYETEKKEQTIALQASNIELQRSRTNLLIIAVVFVLIIGVVLLIAFVGKSRTHNLLVQQKGEIERQNNEREVLLKEIHHRVKNNLQVISSLLNLQSRGMEEGEAKSAVKEGQSRIKSMSLIHQKLYSENNFSRINMKEYIEDLTDILFKSYKPGDKLEKKVEAVDLLMDVDTAVPLGLIINELVSNALKYAFTDDMEGELAISLQESVEGHVLKVSDTGKGLPDNFDKKPSMGMNLVHILVEQLDARMSIDGSFGTTFTIELNKTKAA